MSLDVHRHLSSRHGCGKSPNSQNIITDSGPLNFSYCGQNLNHKIEETHPSTLGHPPHRTSSTR